VPARLLGVAARKGAPRGHAGGPEVPTPWSIRETEEAIAQAMTRGILQQRKSAP
jgi:hypothetical protein